MFNRPPPIERKSIEEATQEASTRSLDFDPNVRAQYVRDSIVEIVKYMKEGLTEQQLQIKFPDFSENYPKLFNKVIANEDLSMVKGMLSMLDKMGDGSITQHEASIIVGKNLVDKFITPQLRGNTPK